MIIRGLLNKNQLLVFHNSTGLTSIDSFGFIVLSAEEKQEAYVRKNLGRKQGIGGVGRGHHVCKGLCKFLKKVSGRKISFSKDKKYFCSTCERAMTCARCRCCGSVGRSEPRGRKHRLDAAYAKYVQ